ncbi:MAG: hypothetical protein K0R80_569 [Clostridia bacterium]|nr:hypothetical protein [Clostridia bacterium]
MNFFYQVKESVIDFKFYKHIKDNRFAKSFLYLFLLLFIIYSMLTVRNYLLVKSVMEQTALEVSQNMPEFELKNGKFSFEGEMPFYVSSSTNELFVIDTTGAVDEKVLQGAVSGILITEDAVHIKNNIQQQTLNFADMKDAEFDKEKLIELLPSFSWLVLIAMLIWFVFVVAGQLIFAVILALIGLAISSSLNTDLKYKHLLNFSIYALTLPMLIDLLVDIAGLPIPQIIFFMIYAAIAGLYLLFAIKAYSESQHHPEQTDEII